ncbi:hypothetical protein [Kitasatospora albolonga]|uniref:hypothetical protein n=1 Tax=Kitasatospora albolonga TaxID=68173 RepID=UPI0031EE589A
MTTPDQVVITSGFYQSIGLLAEVLRASGVTELAAEDPGHRTYREVVARAGLRVLPVPGGRRRRPGGDPDGIGGPAHPLAPVPDRCAAAP